MSSLSYDQAIERLATYCTERSTTPHSMRYEKWCVNICLSEIYSKTSEEVHDDLGAKISELDKKKGKRYVL